MPDRCFSLGQSRNTMRDGESQARDTAVTRTSRCSCHAAGVRDKLTPDSSSIGNSGGKLCQSSRNDASTKCRKTTGIYGLIALRRPVSREFIPEEFCFFSRGRFRFPKNRLERTIPIEKVLPGFRAAGMSIAVLPHILQNVQVHRDGMGGKCHAEVLQGSARQSAHDGLSAAVGVLSRSLADGMLKQNSRINPFTAVVHQRSNLFVIGKTRRG
jgi:hypothetical protein